MKPEMGEWEAARLLLAFAGVTVIVMFLASGMDMDWIRIGGYVAFGGAMAGLGALVTMWLVFGSTLWWDEGEHELTSSPDVDGATYEYQADEVVTISGSDPRVLAVYPEDHHPEDSAYLRSVVRDRMKRYVG
jgi:hypothetical protein